MERNTRKVLVGTVTSSCNDKTITVSIETHRRHPLYGKRIKFSKKIAVHDEQNLAKVGDVVEIMETRPLSKTKRYRLVKIVQSAVII